MEQKGVLRRKVEPLDATGYEEIVVAVVGSVDSGKSSTVGTLVSDTLDDGNGKSRSIVFVHPHERATGRTSDVAYQYIKDEESKRIITFVDLAGHETYLKTTISGLTAAAPDFAIVCISDKITKMTKEHIGLCYAMGIPFLILFTKCDLIPLDKTAELITMMKRLLQSQKSKMFHFRDKADFKLIENVQTTSVIPFLMTSNKTGVGLDLVKHALRVFKKRPRSLPNGFVVEHVYNVPGHGTVLSGVSGVDISRGDTLYMGPFSKGDFLQTTVRSIHNDYRYDVETLRAGQRGCLAIGFKERRDRKLRKGLLLSKVLPDNICKEFKATVSILHHATTIRPGYQAFVNCGMLREPMKFTKLLDMSGNELNHVRSGDKIQVLLEFPKNLNYVYPSQKIAFREGTVRGFGEVTEVIKL